MADNPVTREEKYLAYLTGDYTGEIPKPITRKEKYLYELCLKGIGGEISPEEIKNAVNEYLEKNPVLPGATTEQAQQIDQNKTDVAALKEETGSLKENITYVTETIYGDKFLKTLETVKTELYYAKHVWFIPLNLYSKVTQCCFISRHYQMARIKHIYVTKARLPYRILLLQSKIIIVQLNILSLEKNMHISVCMRKKRRMYVI